MQTATEPLLLKLTVLPNMYRQGHRHVKSDKFEKEKTLRDERMIVQLLTMSWLKLSRIQSSLMTGVTGET